MIKRFIDKLDKVGTEAWIAMMNYVDTSIDDLQDRSKCNEEKVDKLREEFNQFKDELGDVKAVIESNTELSKTIKKTALSTAVGGIVTYLLIKIGIGG